MHSTGKCSQNSSIVWPVWLNGWVRVYELSGFGWIPVAVTFNVEGFDKCGYVRWKNWLQLIDILSTDVIFKIGQTYLIAIWSSTSKEHKVNSRILWMVYTANMNLKLNKELSS